MTYGHLPAPRNTLAVASLVTAFLIWPVGLVLSVLALRQIATTHERGRGLAIAALAISAGTMALICVAVAFLPDSAVAVG